MAADDSGNRSPVSGYRHWKTLGDGFMVSLVIVGPTFLFEELWRGRPMIDQGGAWWLVPALIMAIGFFVGGMVAGKNRRHRRGAITQGVATSGLTLLMIFIADVIRRGELNNPFSLGVLKLWFWCSLGALLVGALGGLYGRRANIKARHRHQMGRFH
jgi:hypothetical protein